MSKKILFFGNERLATGVYSSVPTFQALLASGYDIPAVIVAQNETGRSRRGRRLEISIIAGQHGIPVLAPADLLKARGQLAGFGAPAAVLIAYGKIVPPAVLELFPKGIINVHPSLLPLHRGPAPIESAILNGDGQTGVSLMRLGNQMDTGPLYAQTVVPLEDNETKQGLADRLAVIGSDLVLEHLPKVLEGSVEPRPQDKAGATYDQHITTADARLNWNKPAARLEREVRAYAGWPRSRARIGSTDVIITKAHVEQGAVDNKPGAAGLCKPGTLRVNDKQLGVHCGQGTLVIDSLIPAGKREMPAAAFLAGHRLT